MPRMNVSETLLRGKACERRGELDAARRLYQDVLAAFPGNARAREAFARLGPVGDPPRAALDQIAQLFQMGRPGPALAQAEALTARHPESFTLWNMRGVINLRLGRRAEAEAAFQRAAALNPEDCDTQNNLANLLFEQGKLEAAVECYRRAIALKPDFAEALGNLGNALQELGDIDGAIEAARRAIALKPDYAGAYSSLGTALMARGDLEDAAECYRRALALAPGHVSAQNNLGNALKEMGAVEAAVESYRRALELAPNDPMTLRNLGIALDGMGAFDEAEDCYRRVLALQPGHAETYRHLSALVQFEPDRPELVAMEGLYSAEGTGPQDRCHLCFALAKAYEDIGDLGTAFARLSEGNALRKDILGYDFAEDAAFFASIRAAAVGLRSAPAPKTPAGVVPIFILGMPRSGTTLIEQILTCHSELAGGGELPHVDRFGAALATGAQPPTAEALHAFRAAYLERASAMAGAAPYITDKMPNNFRYIGLIRAALPEARIVHVTRDPAAVCWSNFRHYFSTTGLGYCYDLKDVVAYYRLYAELMDFWRAEFPGQVIDVDYDSLTENQEEETKTLVGRLGLDWQDACLQPQRNRRGVLTSSQRQVRQAVYRGSSASWKRYADQLAGAFDGLAR